ncbi:MAG: class A beta-lactamase-related serine hydrolase [Desulfobulbus sp.]|nr:class A beta-lactamase-related serine hydrolase [Desulfobulbus sp.]
MGKEGAHRLKAPIACLYFLVVALLLTQAADVVAATQSRRYALAYSWDMKWQRVFDYRQRIATLLELQPDSQLKIVAREQEYGIVWNINAPLAQAKKQAEQQNVRLRRAGLKSAQVVATTSFSSLYHIRVSQASGPDALQEEYTRLKNALGPRGEKLAIEQTDSRIWAIIYRGWEKKGEAEKSARDLASRLPRTNRAPVLIAAMDRPAVAIVPAPSLAEDRKKPADAIKNQERASSRQEAGAGFNTRISSLLQAEIRKANMSPQVRTGWAAYDLTADKYIVSINLNQSFQAASMIKPFVALAFFHQVDKGKASYTRQHRQMMEAMIQHSSNQATNWFIRQLGGPTRCEALLKKEYGHLIGQLKFKEYIPPDGRTYLNSVQPYGYIQFLKALWRYQVPNAKELLRVMTLPGPDRLVYGTHLPNSIEVYDKTGTTALLCGDMGILVARDKEGRKVPYAVVGIVERSTKPADYKQWMQASGNVIRKFSSLVYEEMQQKYNLQ